MERLFIKVTRELLPKVRDKYPFLYLERGRLEVDDSSIKWISSEGEIVRLPVATLNCLLLGPGTSVTHAAVKVSASANCSLCWVGEDSLLFYASGHIPTASTSNLKKQIALAANKSKSLSIARKMFNQRFPEDDVETKTLAQLMGMEWKRVKDTYERKGSQYGVGWKGRRFTPGKFEFGDLTNRILTSLNSYLYGICCSTIHSLGLSPHVGFIHSGSPLPFVYDITDLYKEELCIDLAFSLTLSLAGKYDKEVVLYNFKNRVIEMDLLKKMTSDIIKLLELK